MMNNMKRLLLLCTLLISFNSFADEYSDAIDASLRGDDTTAIILYTKAAEQGNAKAQNDLGAIYYYGDGTPQDYKTAIKWWTKAAEQGVGQAQFNLGHLYYLGTGTPQDYKAAIKWYTKSAEQGSAKAQYNLGFLFKRLCC